MDGSGERVDSLDPDAVYFSVNYCNFKPLVTLSGRSFECDAPKLWNFLTS